MIIGAHISMAAGPHEAVEYALSVGCECVQVFAKSPRQWRAAAPDPERGAQFIRSREAAGGLPAFTHTAYLINLSSLDDEARDRSARALADELVRGSVLGAQGVITHVGTAPDGDRESAARRAGSSLAHALAIASESCVPPRLLLENSAGSGTSFGCDVSELAGCVETSGAGVDRIGICIDTCHAYARGYALGDVEGWIGLRTEIDEQLGFDALGAIHANDSKREQGSRVDRHAWIGDGLLGTAGFEAMFEVLGTSDVPVMLEMPGEAPEKDAVNIARLKELRSAVARGPRSL